MTVSVDVVLPVYNGERTCERAALSAVSQEGDVAVRLWCIDDASRDSSPEILRSLSQKHPQIHLTVNPENRGVAASRNLGASLGSAEFIAFLDHDDEWLPDKLQSQLDAFAEDEKAQYVTCLHQNILDTGATRPHWCRPEWLREPMHQLLPSTLMLRRSLWDTIGGFDPKYRAGADDVDWFARARSSRIHNTIVNRLLVRRFIHDRNLSANPQTSPDLLKAVRDRLNKGQAL
jgi:glycosyltransferase involved in cell wall biosynthesis